MLSFPNEFFLEETREGFTIDSTMKSFWAAELEVLREISEICEKYNLQWYAAYGTLLGAIRHEGFVPWDDDMDIWMKREDYNKFMEVAPKELPDGFIVESPLTERGYTEFHSVVFNSKSISTSEKRLHDFHNCPFVVGVDIFPLDTLPDNEEEREGQHAIYMLIALAIELIKKEERTEEDEQDLSDALDTIEEFCGVAFPREYLGTDRTDKLLTAIYKLENQLCTCYGEDEGEYLVMYMDYACWPNKIYKKEWFADVIGQPYECFGIPVPVGYDEILKRIYGDYHVRIRAASTHGYPLYAKQLEQMRETTERLESKAAHIEELREQARAEREAEAAGLKE